MRLMVWCLIGAMACMSLVIALQFRSIYQTREQNKKSACFSWRSFDETMISQIRAGEKLAPTISYYRTHPMELARVIAADEAFVKKLRPPDYC